MRCWKMNKRKLPDRPLGTLARTLRFLIRRTRLLRLQIMSGNRITVGSNVSFGKRCSILSPDFAAFGDNVRLGQDVLVEANLEVGNSVLISSKVSFVGNDHKFDDPKSDVYFQGRNAPSTIRLEGDNLIGNGVIIVGDVVVARGSIVGSGAVLTKSTEENGIYAGVPARWIKSRYR